MLAPRERTATHAAMLSQLQCAAVSRAADRASQIYVHEAKDVSPGVTYGEQAGLHFVKAPNLPAANRAAEILTASFAGQQTLHSLNRASNHSSTRTASAMLGVMLTGPGDWSRVVTLPQLTCSYDDALVRPRQTYQIGELATAGSELSGFVCWAGMGLVRTDTRMYLGQTKRGPGEGCLRVPQIVHEMLSKTGLVTKYGA